MKIKEVVKIEDVFEEYRERLIKNNVDILELEIYETFAGTDFIDNTLDLVELLESKDYKEILCELKAIKEAILNTTTDKYTANERLGYGYIVDGYILRVESEIHRKKGHKKLLNYY